MRANLLSWRPGARPQSSARGWVEINPERRSFCESHHLDDARALGVVAALYIAELGIKVSTSGPWTGEPVGSKPAPADFGAAQLELS